MPDGIGWYMLRTSLVRAAAALDLWRAFSQNRSIAPLHNEVNKLLAM